LDDEASGPFKERLGYLAKNYDSGAAALEAAARALNLHGPMSAIDPSDSDWWYSPAADSLTRNTSTTVTF
jgi:hypothetical protein